MQLISYEQKAGRIVRVDHDRIDAAAVIEFKEMLREIVDHTTGTIILDLGNVEFIDSSGLGAIVAIGKLLHEDRTLELAQLNHVVAEVFKLTHLDRIFTIHEKLPGAELGEEVVRHAS